MFTDIIHKKLEENFASVLKTTESGISEYYEWVPLEKQRID